MPNDKHLILVAGYDYLGFGATDFRKPCLNRSLRLIKQDPSLKYTLFDIRSGIVTLNKPDSNGKRVEKILKTFDKVTTANYSIKNIDGGTHIAFNKKQSGVMSVVDVYKYIQEIGKDNPGSVNELSFFSHGYPTGPVLVNSYEFENEPSKRASTEERDPNDKDCRFKDFEPKNMKPNDLKSLRNAFGKNAIIWSWGCNFGKFVHLILDQLMASPMMKRTNGDKLGTIPESYQFSFTFDKRVAELYFESDTKFFPQKDRDGNYKEDVKYKGNNIIFSREYNVIKPFFRNVLKDTFFALISRKLNIRCYAPFLGTYATFQEHDTSVKLPLMIVPRKVPPYGDNFSKKIKFYTKALNLMEDPEGLGYGIYGIYQPLLSDKLNPFSLQHSI
jgi:hypothetical protein